MAKVKGRKALMTNYESLIRTSGLGVKTVKVKYVLLEKIFVYHFYMQRFDINYLSKLLFVAFFLSFFASERYRNDHQTAWDFEER